jgi:hypothetical protein
MLFPSVIDVLQVEIFISIIIIMWNIINPTRPLTDFFFFQSLELEMRPLWPLVRVAHCSN